MPLNARPLCGLVLFFFYVGYYQSPTILAIHNCFRQKSVHLRLPKIFFSLKQLLLQKYGLFKISNGPKEPRALRG